MKGWFGFKRPADPAPAPVRQQPLRDEAGLPIPPPELIGLVTGGDDHAVFLATGAADRTLILDALNQAEPGRARDRLRILDWGCGCGRIARHWSAPPRPAKLFGCDINEDLVNWSRQNLPFGEFQVSTVLPPLPYQADSFDLVYGISVLTHLTFDQHLAWVQELWRVLSPGGLLVLTAHGPSMLPVILRNAGPENAPRVSVNLIDETSFICIEDAAGSNATGNALSLGFLERLFRPFDLLFQAPRFGLMGIQDTYVFRKRGSKLRVIDRLLSAEMGPGRAWTGSADLRLDGETRFSVLAKASKLYFPSRIEMRLRSPASEPLASTSAVLPDKVSWTGLTAAYALLELPIPAVSGPAKLAIQVETTDFLDDSTLELRNAMFC